MKNFHSESSAQENVAESARSVLAGVGEVLEMVKVKENELSPRDCVAKRIPKCGLGIQVSGIWRTWISRRHSSYTA